MADQTHCAVDSLLGLLSSAITDEARLLGGVQGDIQFIKDEMDSMNGFLLHLTKMEAEHDDQLRAWMKQVRDIAYIAEDCIDLYMRDLKPPQRGFFAFLRHLPVYLWTVPERHRLANKIRELKVRVQEVGQRRLRYDVKVPKGVNPKPIPVAEDGNVNDKRDDFLRALEAKDEEEASSASSSPSLSKAIKLLPSGLGSNAGEEIEAIRNKCVPDHVDSMKMLLRALYAYPYGTKEELKKLNDKLEERRAAASDHLPMVVMVFCYSKLSTHYKSCLQYLTAFLQETSISRTCLVRRWLAEGLVARGDGLRSMEEAGESCFNELVFRGFLHPAEPILVTGLKIKSCRIDPTIEKFIVDMANSENFVVGLPTHLRYQLNIRRIVRPLQQQQPPQNDDDARTKLLQAYVVGEEYGAGDDNPMMAGDGHRNMRPMDKVVKLLKTLREEYRLNVLDLGGCRGLKKRHIKSICKLVSLKYLSLRRTDAHRLPRKINNLRLLETLDVRDTDVRDTDMERIDLPKLKHLLAGCLHIKSHSPAAGGETDCKSLQLSTVRMPHKIARSTEILRHVHVMHGEDLNSQVGTLKKLRKLGVVVDGGKQENIKGFSRTINSVTLSESLRSLSIWIIVATGDGQPVPVDSTDHPSSPLKNLESLNIKGASLPSWIAGAKLSKVTLRDTLLTRNCLRTLGGLPTLRCLRLRHDSYVETNITMMKGEFKDLRLLVVDQVDKVTQIVVEDGAAPNLDKFSWTFNRMHITQDTISGITYLKGLKELELNGDWYGQRCHVDKAVEVHPNHPHLRYSHDVSITEE